MADSNSTDTKLVNIADLATFLTCMRSEIASTISTAINNIGNATTALRGFMSNTDKVKLDGISDGAQVNVIEAISVNGTEQTITNKKISLTISSGTSYSSTEPTTGEAYWEQPY